MNRSGPATWLRIYIGESDQWQHKPLYQALVEFFRKEQVAGATVLRGVEGYGSHSQIHAAHILRVSEDLPMIVEVIDEAKRIEALLPAVREMVREGLIMTSRVNVEMYGHSDQTDAPERTELPRKRIGMGFATMVADMAWPGQRVFGFRVIASRLWRS